MVKRGYLGINGEQNGESSTCSPSLLQKHKGIVNFEVSAGARGQPRASRNHKALVFPRMRRGRRPSASLCGNPLDFALKAEFPAGAFANRGAAPAPNPSSHPKNKPLK
jgi:hypothetical protein